MFKKHILIFLLLQGLISLGFISANNLIKIRLLYLQVGTSEKATDSIINYTKNYSSLSAVHICYHGAAQCAKAQYLINPFGKYTQAKKGISIIEKGVAKDKSSVEARYVRYTIESNLPAIIPFTDHTEEDVKHIKKNLKKTDANYQNIKNYLILKGRLTAEEKKTI